MRPASDAFLRALRGSHRMRSRARVCTSFQTGTNPTGTGLTVLDGDVALDADAAVRSTLDLTVGEISWPSTAGDLLAPYGNEIFVERGVDLGAGTVEWVSLGYFRIDTPEQDRVPDGPIRVAGQDRMAAIKEARLLAPQQFTSGTTYGTVVSTLVTDVYPSATISWDDSTYASTLGRAMVCDDDRFGFLDDLITAVGKVWYWDYRGYLVIKTPPSPSSASVWSINHGHDGVLVSMSRQLTRVGAYNAVVATGVGADTSAPVRAVAIDDNPNSPTYWYGSFGQVPRFYSSPFITTDAQALSAAQSLLRKAIGLPYNVDFGVVANPALEPLDPVEINYAYGTRRETHVLQRLTVPLSASTAMTASTREQTTILLGAL